MDPSENENHIPDDTFSVVEAMIAKAVVVEAVVFEAVINKPGIRGRERDQIQLSNESIPSVMCITFRSKCCGHMWQDPMVWEIIVD